MSIETHPVVPTPRQESAGHMSDIDELERMLNMPFPEEEVAPAADDTVRINADLHATYKQNLLARTPATVEAPAAASRHSAPAANEGRHQAYEPYQGRHRAPEGDDYVGAHRAPEIKSMGIMDAYKEAASEQAASHNRRTAKLARFGAKILKATGVPRIVSDIRENSADLRVGNQLYSADRKAARAERKTNKAYAKEQRRQAKADQARDHATEVQAEADQAGYVPGGLASMRAEIADLRAGSKQHAANRAARRTEKAYAKELARQAAAKELRKKAA